jgi:hypothetical protein
MLPQKVNLLAGEDIIQVKSTNHQFLTLLIALKALIVFFPLRSLVAELIQSL